jgi:hypothetical protein
MEKCCDACGDGEYYFRSGIPALQTVTVFQRHRLPLTRCRWDIRLGELYWQDADFLCISCICAAVMEKCCDACGDGEYYFWSGYSGVTG